MQIYYLLMVLIRKICLRGLTQTFKYVVRWLFIFISHPRIVPIFAGITP